LTTYIWHGKRREKEKLPNNIYSRRPKYLSNFARSSANSQGQTAQFSKSLTIIEFEKDLERNLLDLRFELLSLTYKPIPLVTFVLRDPKTRVISKSDFRDRVVHHALINIIGSAFQKSFIYDSCANQIGKGTTFALKRFEAFSRKVTNNGRFHAFCLKADIRKYFEEVNRDILIKIIKGKVSDNNVLWLIRQILNNAPARSGGERQKGMPIGNYTSQFFANVYLSKLDYFVKHRLRAKYYVRYVDDFIILDMSKRRLDMLKEQIDSFLKSELRLILHPQKSRIIPLSRGIDFVGFRNFNRFKLLRKRNIRGMRRKIDLYRKGLMDFTSLKESYQGWQAYARWGNTHNLRNRIKMKIIDTLWDRI